MKSIEETQADYNSFVDIQIKKYLSFAGKDEISDEDELELVINKIVAAYNKEIVIEKLKLDNLGESAKKRMVQFN